MIRDNKGGDKAVGGCGGQTPHLLFPYCFFFFFFNRRLRAQELCESRGGRPGLSVLTSLIVSVDVKKKKKKKLNHAHALVLACP